MHCLHLAALAISCCIFTEYCPHAGGCIDHSSPPETVKQDFYKTSWIIIDLVVTQLTLKSHQLCLLSLEYHLEAALWIAWSIKVARSEWPMVTLQHSKSLLTPTGKDRAMRAGLSLSSVSRCVEVTHDVEISRCFSFFVFVCLFVCQSVDLMHHIDRAMTNFHKGSIILSAGKLYRDVWLYCTWQVLLTGKTQKQLKVWRGVAENPLNTLNFSTICCKSSTKKPNKNKQTSHKEITSVFLFRIHKLIINPKLFVIVWMFLCVHCHYVSLFVFVDN